MRVLVVIGLLAAVSPAAAVADPLPDPTVAPAYSPTPGTVPAGAQPPPDKTSSHLTVIGHGRIVLDAKHLRTTLEVRCAAARQCDATGTLTVKRHGRTVRLGAWAGRIGGQRIATPRFVLTRTVRTLRAGHPVHALLRLTNHASAARAVAPAPITTVVNVPVTLVLDALPAPDATTGPASGITLPNLENGGEPGSAVVAGIVDPHGVATSYHFEYGPANGAYGVSVPAAGASLPGDGLEHLVTATLPGFGTPSTVHYRLVASSLGGTTFGADHQLSIGFEQPPLAGAPLGDVTAAGLMVPQIIGNQCVTTAPQLIAGATLTCTITALDPQPPLVDQITAPTNVRPASIVLAVHAPEGMIGATTRSAIEPLRLTIAPMTAAAGTVSFVIEHPSLSGVPEMAQAVGAPVSLGVTPQDIALSDVSASIRCVTDKDTFKGRAVNGNLIACTTTTRNAGLDAADFSSFKLIPTAGLTPVETTDGDPPQVLAGTPAGGGAPTTSTTTFRIDGARSGASVSVILSAQGRDETSRNPFAVLKVSNAITVEQSSR